MREVDLPKAKTEGEKRVTEDAGRPGGRPLQERIIGCRGGVSPPVPPSEEGGGFAKGKDGGRDE